MRLSKLDALRGITLLSMIAYHTMWDLVYLYGEDVPWYAKTPGFVWQQSICWTFILLSGFSWSLGHHHFKRGLTVFFAGALVTLVTCLFMPEEVVWFGILTFMGSAMLLMIPLDRLFGKRNTAFLLISALISFALFMVTGNISSSGFPGGNYFTTFLGFPFPGFFSTDYFPVIPWFFLYFTGYAASRITPEKYKAHLVDSICPPLEFIGRHTLIIYLLHQPVIFGITNLIFS